MALRPVQGDPATNGNWGTLLAAWFDTFSNADSSAPGGPLKAAAVQSALGGSITPVFNVKDSVYGAVGDGSTDDTTAINAAISALTAAGKGVLYFPAGVYITTGGHTLSVPCMVRGSSRGSAGAGNFGAVLQLKNASNASMFTVTGKFVTIRDLGLDGNYANQSGTSHGIVASAAAYGILDSLYVTNFHDDGITFTNTSSGWHVSNLQIRSCQGHGINVTALSVDNDFYSIDIGTSGLSGVKIAASDIVFTQLHTWGNGTPGAANDKEGVTLITGASSCRFVNCYFETNVQAGARFVNSNIRGVVFVGCHFWKNGGQGVYAFGSINAVFQGCAVWDNGQNVSTAVNNAGIVNDSGSYMTVTGCVFYDDQGTKTQSYGYYEVSTADHNTIIGNSIAATHLKTGSTTITGAANVPVAASMGTYNQV